jgi:hypothetical protein
MALEPDKLPRDMKIDTYPPMEGYPVYYSHHAVEVLRREYRRLVLQHIENSNKVSYPEAEAVKLQLILLQASITAMSDSLPFGVLSAIPKEPCE